MQQLLPMAEFDSGARYADHNPSTAWSPRERRCRRSPARSRRRGRCAGRAGGADRLRARAAAHPAAALSARRSARGYSPQVTARLQHLMQQGHTVLYRAPRPRWRRAAEFLFAEFPQLVRSQAGYMAAATALFVVPLVTIFVLLQFRPELIHGLMDPMQVTQVERNPAASAQKLGRDSGTDWQMLARRPRRSSWSAAAGQRRRGLVLRPLRTRRAGDRAAATRRGRLQPAVRAAPDPARRRRACRVAATPGPGGAPHDSVVLYGDPRMLGKADGDALLDWVEHGGHLVLRTPTAEVKRGDVPILEALDITVEARSAAAAALEGEDRTRALRRRQRGCRNWISSRTRTTGSAGCSRARRWKTIRCCAAAGCARPATACWHARCWGRTTARAPST
ncbi:DUF2167 domain-containing protein [Pantoea ananatis]|uniref:DUF2167 domain-containing protein n=1 Tax=Pantoea ananas TaxID=553 RepID=UPI0022205BB6|nr:DUF2167 domain-containing protein [Pantoea ananatis]